MAIDQAPGERPAGQQHPRVRFQLRHRDQRGRRRLRLRRRNGPHRLHRRQRRGAAAPAALSRRNTACGASPPSSTTWKPGPTCRIINHGADWFAAIGTDKSKGTKVFALAGKVQQHRPGGSADGHHPARDRLRHRRRHPRRQGIQGGPDRRPLRRLHPRAVPGHCRWITTACNRSRAPSWAPAA